METKSVQPDASGSRAEPGEVLIRGRHQRFNLVDGPNFRDKAMLSLWNRSPGTVYYTFEEFLADEVRCEGTTVWRERLRPEERVLLNLTVSKEAASRTPSHPGWEPGPEGWDITMTGSICLYRADPLGDGRDILNNFPPPPDSQRKLTWYVTVPKEREYAAEDFVLNYAVLPEIQA
jgi:hypothetical protein